MMTYLINTKLKLLSFFILLNIIVPVYALSPKSITKKKIIHNYTIFQNMIKSSKTFVIVLSKANQYPNLNNKFQSILFINLDKLVDDNKIRGFLEGDAAFQIESIKNSPINKETKNLYMLLKQIVMRFQGYYLPNINLFITKQIQEYLYSKGYSWRAINKTSYFDPGYIFQEIFKNAIIHGNSLDFTKPVYVGWEIINNTFILRVGDHSPANLKINDNSLFKISGTQKTPQFDEKLKVASFTMLTGKKQGVNDLQTWNNGNWSLNIEPIVTDEGEIVGKFINASFNLQKKVEKQKFFPLFKKIIDFTSIFSAA